MATQQLQLVYDNSTLANFKAWAKPISDWFRTCGWTNSADSGQVNWTTVTLPGANTYVYDVFQPGDALTTFYVKMEYGNVVSGTNSPGIRITIGTGSNGSGTLTGFVSTAAANLAAITAPSSVTQYECNFHGSNNRIAVMMWRNAAPSAPPQIFAIERSCDSGGNYTSTYVTLWAALNASSSNPATTQQSVMFGPGVAPRLVTAPSNNYSGMGVRAVSTNGVYAFNNAIPFDAAAPMVGFWDYSSTAVGAVSSGDITEGVTFTVTLYGATRTYMPTKNTTSAPTFGATLAYCMRYD